MIIIYKGYYKNQFVQQFNPYLAFRDNSRAGGVCQLKSPSYLQ